MLPRGARDDTFVWVDARLTYALGVTPRPNTNV
jgi:hypothetical protein